MRKKSKKRKKAFALEIIERLKKAYPDSDCTLDYNEAWKLLVSVRLAAQCTDARVNVIVQDLYAEYPTIDAIANADVEEIERIVRPCGLGRSKARDISACMKMLRDEFDCKVPDDFDMGYQSLVEAAESLGFIARKPKSRTVSFTVMRKQNLFSKENQEILFTMSQ